MTEPRIRFNWGFWNGRNGGLRPGFGHFDLFYVAGDTYGRYTNYRHDETSDRAWKDFQSARKQKAYGGRRRLNPIRNYEPTLREATAQRLSEIADVFQSGHGEHTGKLRYHAGTREVAGRIGGMKAAYPELRHVQDSPGAIVRAVRRGKGKVYWRLKRAVRRDLSRHYDDPPKRLGPMVVPSHPAVRQMTGRVYCPSCGGMHAKGQHASHGVGSHERQRMVKRKLRVRANPPHALTVKPGPKDDPAWVGDEARWSRMTDEYLLKEWREMQKASFDRMFGHNAVQARARIARELRRRGITSIPDFWGGPDIQLNRGMRSRARVARKMARLQVNTPRKPVKIYGRILRIEAQKTGPHKCNASCVKAGHRYFHNFKSGSAIYGNADGSLTIRKNRN